MAQPQLVNAINGWMTSIEMLLVTQTVDKDGYVTEKFSHINFRGCVTPATTAKHLVLSKQGQRAWSRVRIFMPSTEMSLNVSDCLIWNKMRFKVVEYSDFSQNGFKQYLAIQDYTTEE